ncbi:hypothetical protein CC2G_000240 [Coprinopsis cinerea AmutBmut pab1-1]|nr:hypothetical protein CC2G_000240 [Coprinopsis cinerea AmutBmut pab1-1]
MGNIASSIVDSDAGMRIWGWFPVSLKGRIARKASLFRLLEGAKRYQGLKKVGNQEIDRRIVELLKTYRLDPFETLVTLFEARSLISGSGALWVLKPDLFQPGDLDFYVPERGFPRLRLLLIRSAGWRLLGDHELHIIGKKPMPEYCELPFVSAIWFFYNNTAKKVINVIETVDPTPFPAILQFHSTVVMNVISYFGVVSLYQEPTTKRVGWVNFQGRPRPRDVEWMEKYKGRGYGVYKDSKLGGLLGSHRCGHDVNCAQTERSLFDEGVGVGLLTGYEGMNVRMLLESIEPEFTWRLHNSRCFKRSPGGGGWVRIEEGCFSL